MVTAVAEEMGERLDVDETSRGPEGECDDLILSYTGPYRGRLMRVFADLPMDRRSYRLVIRPKSPGKGSKSGVESCFYYVL